ncbi:unnamed protein product [Spodoptera littoralis]|uniref:TLC domain-containing protein n=1 Tax=Spodoptera littoralis TaxID=7109 RepID=A0A9P0IGD2_SPOLI|nr:unnamed protein product [Spodoptera littoralis]CAH1646799.1 unnamed protein product [Spodoptera littoralis]
MRHDLSVPNLLKLTSFVLWNWLYFFTVEYAPDKSPEWCCRVITFLHGSVATAVGLTQCQFRNLAPWHFSRKLSACQYFLMVWSWGYFAFDLLWCLVYWTESVVMLLHHITALVAITRYMQKDCAGCTYSCTLVLLEITNPVLQTRWFLKHEGYGNTTFYFIVEVLYLSMFLVLRGILGTYLMYYVFNTGYFDWEEKVLSLTFYVVSLAFVYDIAGYIRYKYRNEISEFREFYYATQIYTESEEFRRRALTHSEILNTM